MIPRIIHQTWKDRHIPRPWEGSAESWKRHHPGWTYRFWTDEELRDLIRQRFPRFLRIYDRYPFPIQRVDAARYALLYEYGGVYSDLDILCNRSLEPLRGYEVVIPETDPVGYSNDLMLASRRHSFFRYLMEGLVSAERINRVPLLPCYPKVMLSTGSLYLTVRLRRYASRQEISIMPPRLYGSRASSVAYVTHTEGNSWHRWDGKLIRKLYGLFVGTGSGGPAHSRPDSVPDRRQDRFLNRPADQEGSSAGSRAPVGLTGDSGFRTAGVWTP